MPADDLERRAQFLAQALLPECGDYVVKRILVDLLETRREAIAEERERCAAICDARRAPCAAHAIRDGVQRDGPGRQEILDALGAALMYQDDTDRFAEAREVYESAIRKGPGDGE